MIGVSPTRRYSLIKRVGALSEVEGGKREHPGGAGVPGIRKPEGWSLGMDQKMRVRMS